MLQFGCHQQMSLILTRVTFDKNLCGFNTGMASTLAIQPSGLKHAWKCRPLLVHASTLDPQEQGEKVLIIHGTRSSTALVLQPTLSLWVKEQ